MARTLVYICNAIGINGLSSCLNPEFINIRNADMHSLHELPPLLTNLCLKKYRKIYLHMKQSVLHIV